MIDIKSKYDCCGCSACESSCPAQCITMSEDNEGFLYPEITRDLCLNCERCVHVCPVLNVMEDKKEYPEAFGVYSIDDNAKLISSSGGVFYSIAQNVLNESGIVYGARMSDDCRTLSHIMVDNIANLAALCGSKYIQSETLGVYNKIKIQLESGKKVLFCGTPCQTEALKLFLNKEYSTLYLIDFICHGVSSPKLWGEYLSYLEKKYSDVTKEVAFRYKKYGWRLFSIYVRFRKAKYIEFFKKDMWGQAYLQNISLRPSCYMCRFKKLRRISDITIGDFWGRIQGIADDDKGLSLVLVHSNKGKIILNSISNECVITEVDATKVINSNKAYFESVVENPIRNELFSELGQAPIEKLLKKHVSGNISLKLRLMFILKKLNIKQR